MVLPASEKGSSDLRTTLRDAAKKIIAPEHVCVRRVGFGLVLLCVTSLAILSNVQAAEDIRFDREVWPILTARCIQCHGEAEQEGKLRLDSPEAIRLGGEYGDVIAPGDPEESTLFELITLPDGDTDAMPGKGDRLTPNEIDIIRRWIVGGASLDGWTPALQLAANAAVAAAKRAVIVKVPPLPKQALEFNRDIRPILSNKCFSCHGHDGNARKADLRLDLAASAYSDRNGSKAIVPRDLKTSELVRRIFHPDADERMPPADAKRQPTEQERRLLAAWVAQGGEYESHWAYIPPELIQPSGPREPIDALVNAKLVEYDLPPSERADPITLARRLSLDLLGLPADPARVDEFTAYPTDTAYADLVDELLASSHFGERMAVHWLDQVRYADSNGYHSDEFREMSAYRDYVINAFNANKPYDQFTIEQLAGDLLPSATQEQIIASGFNRLSQITAEGGAQAKEYRVKYSADRVRAVASVWMGATLGCAECHDHKFDPYTAKDFYSMAAFFADIDEDDVYPGSSDWIPLMELPTPDQQARKQRIQMQIASLEQTLASSTEDLEKGQGKWEKSLRKNGKTLDKGWMYAKPESFESKGGATLELLDDLSILSTGKLPFSEVYTVVLPTDRENITGLRIEGMNHHTFSGAVTRFRRVFYVNELEVEILPPDSDDALSVKMIAADASMGVPENAIDGKFSSAWFSYTSGQGNSPSVLAAFTFADPIPAGPGTRLVVRIHHTGGAMFDRSAFGRLRFALTTNPEPEYKATDIVPEFTVTAARKKGKQSSEDAEWMARYYRTVAAELETAREELSEVFVDRRDLRRETLTTMVSRSIPPRDIRILARGDWQDESGEIVQPDVPESLPPLNVEGRRATRLDLANWMVAEENPLTARVFVNRLWELFFGEGLSRVLNDLGSQGEWPTHPELLDWLATEFVDSGWDVKHMVRLIVTSDTYKQSSNLRKDLRQIDPDNRWLARQSALRLDAEFIRDTALAVSGLLNDEIGGKSVRPYQPKDYWENLNFPKRKYTHDKGDKQYRRGLYTHWQRSFLHPSLYAFDAPSREECVAQRPVSNTPLQALVLLNDPTYVEAARKFAERIMLEGGREADARIAWAFRQALSRRPSTDEIQVLHDVYANHLREYETDVQAAEDLLSTGLAEIETGLDKTELAAWTSVARVILNLHETITRS